MDNHLVLVRQGFVFTELTPTTLLGGWVIMLDIIVLVGMTMRLVLVKTERTVLMAFDAGDVHSS